MGAEIRDNIRDNQGLFSVIKDVHVGDFVELFGDRQFFKRREGDERYGGYITSMDKGIIGISPTHPLNNWHGYTDENINPSQKITEINIRLIKRYRIL